MPMPKREQWITRILKDEKSLIKALNVAMKEMNPEWGIQKCQIKGSLGRYLLGQKELFKTPFGGKSGAEERGTIIPANYLSDIDIECKTTPNTDFWYKGSTVAEAEDKIRENPKKYLPHSRNGKCINYHGNKIVSVACNDPFKLPLDEPDLRRTQAVVLHLRKIGGEKTLP